MDHQNQIEKKFKAREKKFQKPKMKVTGKSVFALQRLANASAGTRILKTQKKK